MERFNIIREAGAVRRYHTSQTIRCQNVAEHSWHVAQIVRYIYPGASKDLIIAAIDHDVGEIHTGDIPAPFKWAYPNIAQEIKTVEADYNKYLGTGHVLDSTEAEILHYADMLDCLLWCKEEILMGNTHLHGIFGRAYESLAKRWSPSTQAAKLLESCADLYAML